VTWIMTLRPQPRYFLFPIYAATIAVALLLAQETGGRAAQYVRRGVMTLTLVFEVMVTLLTPDHQLPARLAVAWIQRHPDTIAHFADLESARRIAFPAILGKVGDQISTASTPIGGVRLREQTQPLGTGAWQPIEELRAALPFPYLGNRKVVVVERRIG
jgi:hypothetical protein